MNFYRLFLTILLSVLVSTFMLKDVKAQGTGTIIVKLETDPPTSGVDFNFSSPLLLAVNSPGSIAGDYLAGGAAFGPQLNMVGITGDLQLANPILGAPDPLDDLTGKIAVIDRGLYAFVTKVKNAQDKGALAVIIINNNPGQGIITMGGIDATITIPSIFISYEDGQIIKSELLSGNVSATLRSSGPSGGFVLQHANSQTFTNVPAGSYSVTEANAYLSPPYGFMLVSINIVDPDGGSSFNLNNRTASIDLDAGETVEVTFINKQCPMDPPTANRKINTEHTVTLAVVENGFAFDNIPVEFNVFSGPNTGKSATVLTDVNGIATFTYLGDGGYGTDKISADVAGLFACHAEVNWGSYDIYTVNTKNGNVERVTFLDDTDEYNPSFNNNGKLVAHDVVSSSDPFGQSIYITDVKSGVSTLLAGAEGGNDASWSPNGKYIAFDRIPAGDVSIYVVSDDGGTATLVRENAYDAEWSNNSKRLVFTNSPDFYLKTVDLNGGSETSLGVQGIHASWSPDGKYITYSNEINIFKIAVNEKGEPKGSPFQLTTDGSYVDGIYNQQPSWSNDGKTISFHSTRESGDFDIWKISSSGGTPTLLAGRSDMGDYDPSYSKNGKYAAYAGFTPAGSSLPKAGSDNGKTISADKNSIPNQFELTQNYPNPFNPSTVISYAIPTASNVRIEVFNITGEKVATLVDGFKSEGYYEVSFNASGLPSGLYLYRISAGAFVTTKKMVLMK